MIIQAQVGPQATSSSLATTTNPAVRMGNMGDLIISELHGRYYEAAYRRTLFSAANQAAVATVALGTTAYTGLAISNSIGSTVNLVLLKASYALSVAVTTAGYLGIETGFNASTGVTHTTPGTVSSNFIGVGNAGTGLVDTAATLPTAPTARMFLANTGTVATTGFNTSAPQVVDLEGSIILPPGAYASFYTFATNTASWFFSFLWEEVPV